jgi:benzoyl-CoA reductase/2-hydroxyglutaryl-CoA dehydratase subunit BcrC/BadD/HgdB
MKFKTTFDIFGFYDWVRECGMPIAHCSAFAPAEALLAAGIMPVYPENHAAILGALSPTRDVDNPYSHKAIDRSVNERELSSPKLCCYALSDIGVLLGEESPIGGLPAADLFYACNSQCNVVERWGDQVQLICGERDLDVPHYVLRTPRLAKREIHTEEEIADFRAQLEGHIEEITKRFGTTYSEEKLKEYTAESDKANALWQECLKMAKLSPAPWSDFDAFTAMAPIVIARGLPICTKYYEDLLAEIKQNVTDGVTAIENEQVRLVWDAIPIWPRKNWLQNLAAEQNAVFVASTYTHSWWFTFDADNAMDSLCRRYAWNTMNRSLDWIYGWTMDMMRDWNATGIVCHWNHSCGIWNSYVKRRLPLYKENGIPHIVIEADMVDARHFDEERVTEQMTEFISQLKESACTA